MAAPSSGTFRSFIKSKNGMVLLIVALIGLPIIGRFLPFPVSMVSAAFIQSAVVKPFEVPSGSMQPAIGIADRILVNRFIYRFQPIASGDVIAFSSPPPEEPDVTYVKRVIALPGDVLEIRGGKILVNGEVLNVAGATAPEYQRPLEEVPAGMLFVLGDNRDFSHDSHNWGYLPEDNVIGRVELVYWPLRNVRLLNNAAEPSV